MLCAPRTEPAKGQSRPSGDAPFRKQGLGLCPQRTTSPFRPERRGRFARARRRPFFPVPREGAFRLHPQSRRRAEVQRSAETSNPNRKAKTMTTTDRIPYPTKFPLGQIVATQGALAACDPHHLQGGITAYPIPASMFWCCGLKPLKRVTAHPFG